MKQIPSIIKSRINRLAHELGQKHAAEVRNRLMAELEALAANGSTLDVLTAYIDKESKK